MPLWSPRCVARGLHILRLPLQLLSTIKSAACCGHRSMFAWSCVAAALSARSHAVSLAYVGAFGCRIGLFVALRSWLACAVLSVWLSLAELGLLHRPSSLSPVVAVRHSLIGRRAVWCFGVRQVIGFGGAGVEVDFEARGGC